MSQQARNDPDSPENQRATLDNEREAFALKMMHEADRAKPECESCGAEGPWLPMGQFDHICPDCGGNEP